MSKNYSKADNLLQEILKDEHLGKVGEFDFNDYDTLQEALDSDNVYVRTIARLIDDIDQNIGKKDMYNRISNFLIENI